MVATLVVYVILFCAGTYVVYVISLDTREGAGIGLAIITLWNGGVSVVLGITGLLISRRAKKAHPGEAPKLAMSVMIAALLFTIAPVAIGLEFGAADLAYQIIHRDDIAAEKDAEEGYTESVYTYLQAKFKHPGKVVKADLAGQFVPVVTVNFEIEGVTSTEPIAPEVLVTETRHFDDLGRGGTYRLKGISDYDAVIEFINYVSSTVTGREVRLELPDYETFRKKLEREADIIWGMNPSFSEEYYLNSNRIVPAKIFFEGRELGAAFAP